MREFWSVILMSLVTVSVGVACYFVGSNKGLREQDSRVIVELRQNNKKLAQLINFEIKRDTTGVFKSIVEKHLLVK